MNCLAQLRKPLYVRDLAILKSFDGLKYKLTRSSCVRNKGVEDDRPHPQKGTVNEEKLSNNIIRARNKVREYGYCNDWEYFVTMTINRYFYDRYDLKSFKKVLFQWIRDYNKKHGTNIKYLLVPEKHKDGAWHLHGFIMGLPAEHLVPFTFDQKLPSYIRNKVKDGEPIYNWPAYAEKFGFIDVEPVHSRERATSYVTKYITKYLEDSVSELGAHLYYCSKGLKRAQEMKRGVMAATITPDFENDFCKVNWFDGASKTAEELCSFISNSKDSIHQEGTDFNDLAAGIFGVSCGAADSGEHRGYFEILPAISRSVLSLFDTGEGYSGHYPGRSPLLLSEPG